jgi:transcriptional regulator with XRE-family HTH domain
VTDSQAADVGDDDSARTHLAREVRRLRKVAGWSQPQLAQEIGYTRQYVSQAEQEGKNLPSQELVSALDVALGAGGALLALRRQAKAEQAARRRGITEAQLRFSQAEPGTADDVNRKAFLRAALGMSAGAVVARSFPEHGAEDLVSAVAGPTTQYRRMESMVSTADLVPAVEAHLRLASRVVEETIPTPAGYGVLSETAGLAAWLAADRSDTATARKRYAAARGYAEQARHPLLAAYMQASLGHFAVESGDPLHGRTLLDQVREEIKDVDVPDAARAWLASLHALAHVALGDRAATLVDLRAAEAFATSDRGEPHWPWVFAFDSSKVARYQATAFARLGDIQAARSAFVAAASALTSPKSRALALTDQAHALARAGQVDEACWLATDALSTGRTYGSERITERVVSMRALLPANTSATAELDAQLDDLYGEA